MKRDVIVKALVVPGEGPSRGLLHDCEILANLRLTFVCSPNNNVMTAP